MKRKVRVYKAEDGQGQYHNQMSQFLKRAQMGMEQQAQQPDMQQIVMQVAGMLMPPPDGQGADAEQVYQSLIQSYGEAAATQIINVAVGMVQQSSGSEQAAGQEMAQEEEESVDDLTMQEELIREERERQQEQRDAEYMAEDDEFMYDLLYGDEEAQQEEQPEAKHGGAHHKKFVKKAMKLARKQMGDAGNGQGKNKADIFDGAMKRSEDFTNNLKNEATLSLLEKQFKNMSQAAPQMNAGQQFAYGGSQFGGMTGYGLDRFVYGGYDPSVPDLTEAMYGYQTGGMIAINDKDGNRRYVTQEEADNWNNAIKDDPDMLLSDLSFKSESPMNDPNYKMWSDLKDKGVNVGDYRQGINYKQFANSGNKNTNYNYVEKPYSTDNIWDALIPNNRIFGKKYTMYGPMNHLGLPFTGPFNPMSMMNGFDVDKQRLGFGHKRYTFTPKGASSASGTGMGTGAGSGAGFVPGPGQAVDAMGKPVTSQKQLEMSYLNPAYLRQSGKELKDLNLHPYSKQEMRNARQDLRQYDRAGRKMDRKSDWAQDKFGNNGQKQKGDFWPRLAGFLRTAEKARDGLQTFQGNVNGSSVNNQETPIEFKPRTAKEVWDKYEPELRKQWGSKIGQESELEKGTPSFRVDEENYFNGENFLNMANPMLKGLTNLFNRGEKKNFFGYQNNTSDDLADVNEQRFHGNYNPLSGDFREDLQGQNWQSKYGGVPHMKMGGPKGRTGQQVDYSLGIFPTAMGGSDINQYIGKKKPEISSTLKPVPRDKANLEAEKGETAYGDLNGDGFPEHYEIGGKRHYQGGTPLDLPDDTFIFSDTRSMRISDPKILKMFGKSPKKGGYTPAELAKQYDINAYRKILDDPDSDVVDRKTAEQMIKNFNIKLGALALAQESKKGFPQGIPVVAKPYMETMGISEEDILPKEEEAQQMAQQMMGQQGMPQGEQQAMIPEEQMAMASQEGMMASPEEMGMSPEGMMRYGGMRRLRRAQEGMAQGQPSPEEMAMMQQQQQQGGGDEMAQVMQQVQQALQQGAQPEEVAAQLMQNQMPPEAIMQIFMQIGIPQEEAAGIIQSVIQGAQQAPMAAYGMQMGGYDMPFAQEGTFVMPNLGDPLEIEKRNQEWATRLENNPIKLNVAKDDTKSDFTDWRGDTYHASKHGYADEPWFNMGLTHDQLRNFYQHRGDNMLPINHPNNTNYFWDPSKMAYGGSLDRYQTKGEVKQKVYTEDNLPEGAVIVEKYTRGKKPGDFELQEDGTYRKVTKYDLKPSASSATKQQTAADFAAQSEENKKLLEQANAIIAREIGKGTIEGDADGGDIKLLGNLSLPFNERIILSKALNSNKDFGTDKFKVTKQSATTGYSQKSSRGDYKGTGSFVAGFTPEDYEKRYVYEQLKGMGADDETAFAEIDKIYSDPKQKAGARREYLNFLGVTAPADDAELLDANFYKTRYKDVTTAMERLDESTFRTSKAGGNDLISGFDHFDAMGFEYNPEYEAEQQEQEEEETDEEGDVTEDVEVPVPKYAPWWLQDTIKTAGAFGDLMGVKKYYPWAPKYNPSIPDPTFLDPTRSIAAQSEQARILGDTMSKITPSSSMAASRLAGLQGELAKGAADTANQYDKANVEIANQFAPMQAEMSNKAQEYNLGQTKALYDANTLMNQQYDNSKRAMKQNLLNQYTNAITNRWKTDAMNQLYPQYAVDPATGGRLDFKGGKKQKPTVAKSYGDYYNEAFEITGDSDASAKYALLAWKQSQGEDIGGGAEAVMSMYQKNGGTFTIGPGMLPPFIL